MSICRFCRLLNQLYICNMKWFVYLFSIYLLTLSGFTCKADSDCCKDEMAQQTTSGHHDDDHQTHSACVPFLACGACNSILPMHMSVELPSTSFVIPGTPFFYLEQSCTNSPGSIWQPPRIAWNLPFIYRETVHGQVIISIILDFKWKKHLSLCYCCWSAV